MRCLLGAGSAAGGEARRGGAVSALPEAKSPPRLCGLAFVHPPSPLSQQDGTRLPGDRTTGSPVLLRRPRAGSAGCPGGGGFPGAGAGFGGRSLLSVSPCNSPCSRPYFEKKQVTIFCGIIYAVYS